ncbi:MAG: hypothetical protein KIT54_03340 [Phycisphaeraceae bacterium]|nr:hypothetical protein [Phycisphaeraceae bacterium]
MSVVPSSAAAALAATVAASERASKVQTASKENDEARRAKNGQQTGDRIVLSANAVEKAATATDRPKSQPETPDQPDDQDSTNRLDVQG